MSVIESPTTTRVPTGTWTSDRIHSTFTFSVRHMVVATYRGGFDDFDVTLGADEDGEARLVGAARVASAKTQDPNLDAHLQSPDFFDASRYPEVSYRSTRIVREGEEGIRIEGELTLRGVTRPVELTGSILGPATGLDGSPKLGLQLEGRIDRRDFGITWNAPLPGGGLVLGDQVRLSAELEMGGVER